MGGPPRVGNPRRSGDRVRLQALRQFPDPADGAAALDRRPVYRLEIDAIAGHRDPGGVVAPILEALKTFKQDGRYFPARYRTNDAAHGC